MPNQILDKKESLKDTNNKIELENHEEKLRNEVTNSNNDNTTLISSKQQKDNYNTLKFLDNISSFQEQTTQILHDISNKSIQLQKNIIENNQSTYTHIIENIDTKTFNNINKSIIDSTINLTNLINENILNNFKIITKSNESLQLYYKKIYQNLFNQLTYLNIEKEN